MMQPTGIDNLIAHWGATLNGVQFRPSVFFEMVEEEILMRQIPRLQATRVFWREAGLLSARREYLRLVYRQLVFDICGFPICDSFRVSWWLGVNERTVRNLFYEIPVIGGLLEESLSPVTYFEVDAEAACQQAVHNSVLRVVDDLTEQNQLPRLTGLAREPILADFYE